MNTLSKIGLASVTLFLTFLLKIDVFILCFYLININCIVLNIVFHFYYAWFTLHTFFCPQHCYTTRQNHFLFAINVALSNVLWFWLFFMHWKCIKCLWLKIVHILSAKELQSTKWLINTTTAAPNILIWHLIFHHGHCTQCLFCHVTNIV